MRFHCWSVASILFLQSRQSACFSTTGLARFGTISNSKTRVLLHAATTDVTASNEHEETLLQKDEAEDEGQLLMEFVAHVEQAPPGTLGEEDWMLIRNVMAEFATMESPESAQIVENLLFRMVDEYEASSDEDKLSPCTMDFNTAMNAWEHSSSPLAANHVGYIFFEQEELHNNGVLTAKPDLEGIQTVLRLLAKSRDRGADKRAWSILQSLANYDIKPNAEIFNAVITALAKSKQDGAAERAESLLREAVPRFPPVVDMDGNAEGISIAAFNAVITAWAKSDAEDGPQRAAQVLDYMNELGSSDDSNHFKPNISSFTSLIDAHVQKGEWDSIHQGEVILNHLLDLYFKGESEEPNIATWTIVISAWARLSKRRVKAAAGRADRLLKRLETLYEDGRISVCPDAVAYFTVMNAWAASTSDGAVQKAEDILNQLYDKWLVDGDDSMKPNIRSTRVVMDGWIKSNAPNSMEKAESLLERVNEYHADSFESEADQLSDIYRSILYGWSKQKVPVKAHKYLNAMVSQGMKPDSFCYDKVIEAYTQANEEYSLPQTYKVFELMEQRRLEGDVKPNERVYTSFIRALTKAKVKGLASKASLVVKKMEEMYKDGNKGIKPTVFTYNAVLNACAESYLEKDPKQRLEAFKIAIEQFNHLKSAKEQPDHVTFGNMLQCTSLLPDGPQKDAVITTTFQLCCNYGFVNSYVVRDLQDSAPESLWRSLLQCPEGEVDLARLPGKWSRKFNNRKK